MSLTKRATPARSETATRGPGAAPRASGVVRPLRPAGGAPPGEAELIEPLVAKPGEPSCGYRECPHRVDHAPGKPEIDLCTYHLIRASREHEALVTGERVCLDHELRFPAAQSCPECRA